jgi:predicted aspartyl protease
METITIRVADYYGNPSYYSVMPHDIFDALELASMKDEEFVKVNKEQYERMIADYQVKMKRHEEIS